MTEVIQNTNSSFRGRSLLRLALNGYTQIQIKKILFPIMNFRFSYLSWISSTLTEFRQRNSVPKASICSLSGMNAVQKFALLGLPNESHVSLVRDISLSLNMTYIYLSLQAKRSNDSFSKINKNISNHY